MPKQHTTATKEKIAASLRERNAKVREACATAERLAERLATVGVVVDEKRDGK